MSGARMLGVAIHRFITVIHIREYAAVQNITRKVRERKEWR
jgi:hypothetical protein